MFSLVRDLKLSVLIQNCTFLSNYWAVLCNSAVQAKKNIALRIIDTVFLSTGLGVDLGGAVSIVGVDLTVNRSQFINNMDGSIKSLDSSLLIVNTSFQDNSVMHSGSAILSIGAPQDNSVMKSRNPLLSIGSSLIIYNCSFRNNLAHLSGGAIYSSYSSVFIYNTTFKKKFSSVFRWCYIL